MKCRIAKKISRHFWSRYLDPNHLRHKVSTVRKAVRIYNRHLPKFDKAIYDNNQVDLSYSFSFSATAVYSNEVLIGTCQHSNTILGEKKDGE